MLDPDLDSLESNVFVEYSMERFEHRISAQPQAIGHALDRFNQDESSASRCSIKRATSIASSCSSSSSHSAASSADSSSGSDDNDDSPSGFHRDGRAASLLHINDELVNRLGVLQEDNAALQQKVRQLRASRYDNMVLPAAPPESVDFVRDSVKLLPEYVRMSVKGLPEEPKTDVKFFDPLSLALFKEEELPEMDSLRREVADLSEDKRLLLAENHCLEKEKQALEAALAKARRDVEDAAITVVDKISPAIGNVRTHALDSDVQRLCNLSRLLGDENGRLRSQNRDAEAEVRMLKDELGDMQSQNSRLSIEFSSAKAQKEVLEAEIERLKEAAGKASREADVARARVVEEMEGAQRSIEVLRDEEKRLINENARLERDVAAVLESLEEFEERQAVLRAEKQRAAAEAGRMEAELEEALDRAASEVEAKRKAVERAERAEAAALEQRQDAADVRFQMQRLAQELENEKAAREGALQEMALLRLRERALTQDMRQLRQPGSTCAADHPAAPPPLLLPPPTSALESQLSSWLNERSDLQTVNKELQKQIQKLATGLSDSVHEMEDEVFKWKDITAHLEVALRQARDRSALCEKNAKSLLSDIFPAASSSSKNALHAAAASGALAGFGLLAYVKLKHHMATP